MYINETGYAETFEVSPSTITTIQNEAAAVQQRLDRLKDLSLPFANCAVTNSSMSNSGGWEERHPPICPTVIAAEKDNLEAYKNAERVKILQEHNRGLVLVIG